MFIPKGKSFTFMFARGLLVSVSFNNTEQEIICQCTSNQEHVLSKGDTEVSEEPTMLHYNMYMLHQRGLNKILPALQYTLLLKIQKQFFSLNYPFKMTFYILAQALLSHPSATPCQRIA